MASHLQSTTQHINWRGSPNSYVSFINATVPVKIQQRRRRWIANINCLKIVFVSNSVLLFLWFSTKINQTQRKTNTRVRTKTNAQPRQWKPPPCPIQWQPPPLCDIFCDMRSYLYTFLSRSWYSLVIVSKIVNNSTDSQLEVRGGESSLRVLHV